MDETYHNMHEALELLRSEFPDLTASNLRFWEREGLLRPRRTKGGHRLYSEHDIARVRLIKRLQSQRHYPLEIIRRMLVKLEKTKDVHAEMAFLESLYSPVTYDPDFNPLSREQLADRIGLSSNDAERMEEMGLLFPHSNGNGRRYFDEDDVKVAEIVARELKLGARLDDFAPYVAAMRKLMQEEFNLFHKLTNYAEPTMDRTRQLKETADLVHGILRAKFTRWIISHKEFKE